MSSDTLYEKRYVEVAKTNEIEPGQLKHVEVEKKEILIANIEGKFYSIFSFLFGFGFALQIARAEERGDAKASLFKRRLFWLLIIGLLLGVLASRLLGVR